MNTRVSAMEEFVPSVIKMFLILFLDLVNLLFSGVVKNIFSCQAQFG